MLIVLCKQNFRI